MADFIKSEAADVPIRYGFLRKRSPYKSSIPWMGGKSCVASPFIGIWILRLLPYPANRVYFEPFGGSAAVLINKPAVAKEIYNDADGRLVNFWKQLLNPELEVRLLNTPFAEEVFYEAQMLLDSEDELEAAWAFGVSLWMRNPLPTPLQESTYNLSFYCREIEDKYPFCKNFAKVIDVAALRSRLESVNMCNRDACDLLEKSAKYDYVDIYCDPPYSNTDDGGYNADVDYDRLSELLKRQQGRVAISGVDGDWNHLGWRCETFEKPANLSHKGGKSRLRTECLWMNYPAELSVWDGQMSLGDV